jgi:putative transposase
LDGLWVKIRESFKRKKVVLFALGVRRDGTKEVIDFKVCNSEKGCYCEGFLMNLKERGLSGKNLKLIIHDGAGGLKQAVSLLFSQIPQQLCSVHKSRNIKKKDLLNPSCRKAMRKEAKEVFEAPSKKEAIQKIEKFQAYWENKEPKATKNFLKDIDLCLTFYHYPKHLWSYLKSTNPLERLLREIRRRIRLYDSFSHEKSCELIIYALIKRLNNQTPRLPLASKNKFTQNS